MSNVVRLRREPESTAVRESAPHSLLALVRRPGPALVRCALTHLERQPIDCALALEQHRAYVAALEELGVRVEELPALDDAPDACFVEDPAVVLDEVAVVARPPSPSRRREVGSVEAALAPRRALVRIEEPATLEGGDVLVVEDTLYVGWSQRTNHAGLKALAHLLLPFGYRVKAVEVEGCLHLKTALARVGPRTLLANPAWIHAARIDGVELLPIDPSEPFAANALLAGDTVIYPSGFPRTEARLRARGIAVRTIPLSEFQKAEGGPSCLSLLLLAEEN